MIMQIIIPPLPCTLWTTQIIRLSLPSSRICFPLNSVINVDLTGQVASEQMVFNGRPLPDKRVGRAIGFCHGDHVVPGPYEGSVSFRCNSTHKGTSRILPLLERGSNVTVPRALTQYVATEWGIVNLRGLSNTQRARGAYFHRSS